MVERQPARTERDDSERERCPRQVEIHPAFRYDELNHPRHDQERECAVASRKSKEQHHRQHNFGYAVEVGERGGQRKIVRTAKDVQLGFVFK